MTLDEMRKQKVVSLSPQAANITEVERELELMWEGFRMGYGDEEAVTRACMSNLVIYCDNATEAESVRADLPHILFEHPARVLLLRRGEFCGPQGLCAWVSVYCSNLGQGLQVCGEEVDVACEDNPEQRLPSAARSLLIGDLPTTLWWASVHSPARFGPLFTGLASIADQVIFDSVGWRDPPKDMLALARWSSADQDDQVIHNLTWRRLKPWRRLLSEEMDPVISPGALEQVVNIRIEHGPHGMTSAWLLIGWLADRLGWRVEEGRLLSKSEAQWRFRGRQGAVEVQVVRLPEGEPVIHRIDWRWGGGVPGEALFELHENRKLEARMGGGDGCVRDLSLPRQDRATLVAEQLAYRYRARSFEQALSASNAMTQALVR